MLHSAWAFVPYTRSQKPSGCERALNTKLAVPRWFAWANKDRDAARIFKVQLDYMMSGSLGYVTPDTIKGQKLNYS